MPHCLHRKLWAFSATAPYHPSDTFNVSFLRGSCNQSHRSSTERSLLLLSTSLACHSTYPIVSDCNCSSKLSTAALALHQQLTHRQLHILLASSPPSTHCWSP